MRRRPVTVVALTCLVLVACTTSTSGTPARTPPPVSAPPPGTTQPATPVAPAAPPSTIALLCPDATTDRAIADCATVSLNAYWTSTLHRRVAGRAVLGIPHTLPSGCRFPASAYAIHARTAFFCPDNRVAYYGPVFLVHLHADRPAEQFGERLAATMAHETGHLVQDVMHQRTPTRVSPEAGSRFIEQQADCLSGAWAGGIGLAGAPFLQSARALLVDVDDAEHRRDHGTVAQRLAAVRRGFARGAAACELRGVAR